MLAINMLGVQDTLCAQQGSYSSPHSVSFNKILMEKGEPYAQQSRRRFKFSGVVSTKNSAYFVENCFLKEN
jgi:hypothetical protein